MWPPYDGSLGWKVYIPRNERRVCTSSTLNIFLNGKACSFGIAGCRQASASISAKANWSFLDSRSIEDSCGLPVAPPPPALPRAQLAGNFQPPQPSAAQEKRAAPAGTALPAFSRAQVQASEPPAHPSAAHLAQKTQGNRVAPAASVSSGSADLPLPPRQAGLPQRFC